MHIDFFLSFIGIVVVSVILSFFGNAIGAVLVNMRNAGKEETPEESLKLMILIAGCLTAMVPYKVILAVVVPTVAAAFTDNLKEASVWAYWISMVSGFLFTFIAGSSKE